MVSGRKATAERLSMAIFNSISFFPLGGSTSGSTKSATIEMYVGSSYGGNDTISGETLSSVSEKSGSFISSTDHPDHGHHGHHHGGHHPHSHVVHHHQHHLPTSHEVPNEEEEEEDDEFDVSRKKNKSKT